MSLVRAIFVSLVALLSTTARAAEPTLTLKAGGQTRSFTRTELLARKDATTVEIAADPSYGNAKKTYRAVPAAALFAGLPVDDDAVVQFKCLDGFAAPLQRERLLNTATTKAVAYVAIEPSDAPWPVVKAGKSAGPFYLVWSHPERSRISGEEWPFQLAGFEVKGTLRAMYPKIFPDDQAPEQVRRGFTVFTTNCFACHTMNKTGAGAVGPDLNLPMNPTEYMNRAALVKLVRNPQDVRFFPGSRMSAFPASMLPDADLDALLAYLGHMATRKQP